MQVESEADLAAQLRPGVDGLIIRDGEKRATYLPSVWQGIPEPARFVRELAGKAGWPAGHWPDSAQCVALHDRGVRLSGDCRWTAGALLIAAGPHTTEEFG